MPGWRKTDDFKRDFKRRNTWRMKASVAIDDGGLLAGDLNPRQLRMVQVWVDLHREELLANWELTQIGEEPFRIVSKIQNRTLKAM
jgi:hypothetical protein